MKSKPATRPGVTIPRSTSWLHWSRRLLAAALDPSLTFSVFLLAAVGYIGGFWLTRLGAGDLLTTQRPLSYNDPAIWFHAWTTSIALSTAYWVAIIPPLTVWVVRLRRDFPLPLTWVTRFLYLLTASIALGLIIANPVVLAPSVDTRIPYQEIRGIFVTLVGVGAGIPAVLGILWVSLAARDDKFWSSGVPGSAYVSNLVKLRQNLQRLLLTLGISIGLGILNTGVLRKFILALRADDVRDGTFAYPPELVVLYGLLFTVVMILVYIPAHSALLNRGRELAERSYPVTDEMNASETIKQIKQQNDFVEQLKLGTSVLGDVQNGLVIFAPVLAGLPTMLLR
jgi:hypothetical protein